MRNFRFAWVAVPAALVAACGGARAAAGPRPLDYHFKEQLLSSVPPDQKAEMLAAQREFQRARQDTMRARSDHADSKTAIEAAKNEARRAHAAKDSADKKAGELEESSDWNRVNLAKRDQRVAEVTARSADQKVEMLEARRSWLGEWVTYTGENLYAVEARYELSKAKVARANNVSPPDFAYQAYVDQYEQRRARAEKLKVPADSAKDSWMAEKEEYQARRRDENEARGIDTAAKTADGKGSQ